jgi:4-alpha-glucanotransferase
MWKVVKTKLEVLNDIFSNTSNEFLDDEEYKEFFHANKYWLMPYAAFCYLRDKYQTSDFSNWEIFLFIIRKQLKNLRQKILLPIVIFFSLFRAIPFA